MPQVSVVIVAWNSAGRLGRCLDSIREHAPDAEVLVVDNASGDGTPRMVESEYPWVRLIETGGNLGFPRACNLGARAASGELLFFLNPDARLDNDVPSILAGVFASHPDAGAVGPRILRPDGTPDAFMARRRPSVGLAAQRQFGLRRTGIAAFQDETVPVPDGGEPVAVPCLTGAGIMVPAELYRRLGGMDETLPMYLEDMDLCARIEHPGRVLYVAPEAVLTHEGAASAGRSPRRSLLLAAEDGHAPWLYLRRHGGRARAAAFRAVVLAGSLLRLGAGGVLAAAGACGNGRARALAGRVLPRAAALARWALTPADVFSACLRASFDAPSGGEEPPPLVSLLIHNRDRAEALDRCLASVAEQTCRPLEVVVLDAHSTDGSRDVALRWCRTLGDLGVDASLADVEPAGVPASRNLAATRAAGGLLCFMDNDAVLESPGTLERLRGRMAGDPGLGVLAMRILGPDGRQLDPQCWNHRRDPRAWSRTPFPSFTFTGAGFCVRAGAFRAARGFWEALDYSREEEELSLGLLDAGWTILYAPDVAVIHYADPAGRMDRAARRRIELRNGLMVLWRRLPLPLAAAACCARTAGMTLRGLLREGIAPWTLLGAVAEARRAWNERGCVREPVSWGTALRYAALHVPLGGGDGPEGRK